MSAKTIILLLKTGNSINSLLAGGDFNRLMMAFANSLESDEDRQNVRPDLNQNSLTL